MRNPKNWIIGILIIIIIILLIPSKKNVDSNVLEEIHKLETKIDSLSNKKDSIRIVIDSTNTKIINNNKHYEEVVNTINAQPFSGDSMYILDYLDRLYPSKTNKSNIRGTREVK